MAEASPGPQLLDGEESSVEAGLCPEIHAVSVQRQDALSPGLNRETPQRGAGNDAEERTPGKPTQHLTDAEVSCSLFFGVVIKGKTTELWSEGDRGVFLLGKFSF